MKNRRMLPKPQPVENIEVSEKNTKLKIALFVVAAAVAIVAFGILFWRLLSVDKGWKVVRDESGAQSCSGDFSCRYYLDAGGNGGKKLLASVTDDYVSACAKAYKIFHATETFRGVGNLASVNRAVNAEASVEASLYSAFETVAASGSRALYLAPVYSHYYNIFYAQDEEYASLNDPNRNADLAEKFAEILSYANDPAHVDLQLLGDNKVKLCVSEEYAAFMQAEEYDTYLDFFFLKNAFITDYICDYMGERGHGVLLSCVDGYARSTLADELTYSLNVFHRDGNFENHVGTVTRNGKASAVRLRNYSTDRDARYDLFYTYSDGVTVTPYVNAAGRNESCIDNLLVYSYSENCAEVVLNALPVYVSSEFSEEKIAELKTQSVYSVYCDASEVIYNDSALNEALTLVSSRDYAYTKKHTD